MYFDFNEVADSDNEDWKEHEASRTHSVKFSEDSYTIDKDTPFVRQNTPHPKDLKAKAHKLFAKEKAREDGNLDPLSEEVKKTFLIIRKKLRYFCTGKN